MHYEKGAKSNLGIRFTGTILWIVVILFVLFLLVVADYLDSANNWMPRYWPNNSEPRKDTRIDAPARFAPLATDSDNEIPYIRYDNMTIKALKERFDYASSHGDADTPNNRNNTAGQHILDFAIIGFAKCGTTTMMKWLNMHDEIAVLLKEQMALQKRHPVQIIRTIVHVLPEGRYRRGYKSPNDVEDGRARNKLRIHYPKTRLLVGLRHPVLWFESFYNHRVQNGYEMPNLTDYSSRNSKGFRGGCGKSWNGVCFNRASFHMHLAYWGKTPLLSPNKDDYASFYDAGYTTDSEWNFFSKRDRQELQKAFNTTFVSPNPIFLYDVSQLRMPPATTSVADNEEETRRQKDYENFVFSLQGFLGVPKNLTAMPAMIREKPGKTDVNATEQSRRNKLKIDMCDDQFKLPRQWLLEVGASVSGWVANHFAKSPHGVFLGGDLGNNDQGSSRLLEILESYGKDPCPERLARKNAK